MAEPTGAGAAPVRRLKQIRGARNWGDAAAPFLFRHLAGCEPLSVPMVEDLDQPHFLTIGSVLSMANRHSIVWGTGFISWDDGVGLLDWRRLGSGGCEVRQRPARISAVRGPLTGLKLRSMGIDCPHVYGDPALLFPLILPGAGEKKYRLGLVPHYVDRDLPIVAEYGALPGVRVIDIRRRGEEGLKALVTELLECERILSSSLHGLILADAYGIPNRWMLLSRKLVGGGFKFFDHLLAVGRATRRPLVLRRGLSLGRLLSEIPADPARIDLEGLLAACPFRHAL